MMGLYAGLVLAKWAGMEARSGDMEISGTRITSIDTIAYGSQQKKKEPIMAATIHIACLSSFCRDLPP